MGWLALSVVIEAAAADALGDALLEQGAVSVEVFGLPGTGGDPEPVAEGDGPVVAARVQVSALLDPDADAARVLAAAAEASGLAAPAEFVATPVADQDWVRLTQAQFQPVHVSPRMWVVPSWHIAPEPAAVNLLLDPGLAFGTGTHPTTRLCLQWLDAHVRGAEDVLDYGCGSGILAIAALRLGAGRACGVDIDPKAVEVSRGNAARNGVVAEFFTPGDEPSRRFDIVLANILSNPLKVLAPALAAATRAGGRVVLSGILSEQRDELCDAYAPWFRMDEVLEDEGWVCLAGTRRE
ncbi:MAG TPA: 50S ribosomal protein L11 methyltransferase [Burkholderiales bacterium]|nr:50S ribosomal protein L11 methyltransferase [Burkholderiales bacterium]